VCTTCSEITFIKILEPYKRVYDSFQSSIHSNLKQNKNLRELYFQDQYLLHSDEAVVLCKDTNNVIMYRFNHLNK